MTVTEACKEAIWLRDLYEEITNMNISTPHLIRINNYKTISLAKSLKHNESTKHIAIRHHFIRKAVENQTVTLKYVKSKENTVDIRTKRLACEKQEQHRKG